MAQLSKALIQQIAQQFWKFSFEPVTQAIFIKIFEGSVVAHLEQNHNRHHFRKRHGTQTISVSIESGEHLSLYFRFKMLAKIINYAGCLLLPLWYYLVLLHTKLNTPFSLNFLQILTYETDSSQFSSYFLQKFMLSQSFF